MSFRAIGAAATGALLLALLATKGYAQATAGPFAALAGNWSGGGTLTM